MYLADQIEPCCPKMSAPNVDGSGRLQSTCRESLVGVVIERRAERSRENAKVVAKRISTSVISKYFGYDRDDTLQTQVL